MKQQTCERLRTFLIMQRESGAGWEPGPEHCDCTAAAYNHRAILPDSRTSARLIRGGVHVVSRRKLNMLIVSPPPWFWEDEVTACMFEARVTFISAWLLLTFTAVLMGDLKVHPFKACFNATLLKSPMGAQMFNGACQQK